ncbi:LysR family transcriptional regulator [Massilia sp. P8910]|uniref:LysR family transcriptional regulator n=1 Tax=Massilia antarctica TaxID=2765360 RepID=UPI001E2F8FE3|nr:LysR family transcriptional regulator [Massilia antarctica]MCE3603835.1 LysR family transcriptional regulator [Massilia antarctica]
MDKLRSMEIFTAVVDGGSFTAAAARFDMSAVMVGKHIRFLEERLGARLLARTTRRQSLTEIGEQYVEQCRSILAQVRAAESGAEAMRLAPRGRLRISAPVTFGSESLAPLLPSYLARHPEVSLDLELNDRLVDVVDDGYDAAIRIGELDDSGMIARRLRPYRMLICASPGYLARHGEPRMPADLAQHECLDFMHWKKLVRWRLGDDDGAAPPRVSRFRSNNGQALKQAALAGFGIVMQAEMMLEQEVAAGRLVSLLEAHIPTPRTTHILYPRDRQATPKLTTFVDFLLEHFGPQ